MLEKFRKAPLVVEDTLRCICINKDPIIIVTYGNPMAGATLLSPYLADRKVYFLAGAWWTFLDPQLLESTCVAYYLMKNTFPEHQYVFMTNSLCENSVLDSCGLPNFFCHHNAFIDEKIFKPLPRIQKTLDAVYTARLVKMKRHNLAKNIPAWGLLYGYDASEYKKQMSYLRHLRRIMPGMVLLNGDPEVGQYKHFSPELVCAVYNKAHVGLCLSAMEGGNYSTTEYMLCGLPVVSTYSIGGRELFFDQATSRIVKDDPCEVAKAVNELIEQRTSPHFLRLLTLKKIQKIRHGFIQAVDNILKQEGKQPDFAERFPAVFTNKMFTYPKSPESFVRSSVL